MMVFVVGGVEFFRHVGNRRWYWYLSLCLYSSVVVLVFVVMLVFVGGGVGFVIGGVCIQSRWC